MAYKGIITSAPIPVPMPEEIPADLLSAANGLFIRFGEFGEPSLLPISWVSSICGIAKSWTGYTQQWRKPWGQIYQQYFMASCGSIEDVINAEAFGWRYFLATPKASGIPEIGVNCPSSKEFEQMTGKKDVTCDKCRLCAGASKQAKSIWIFTH